ncbi:hypothetical protein A3D72_00655 [Candidatus Uhrbacteria bacterium RIFCSPHIGHO2_02_FULL_57_19]|uniref:Uncharacterized protein n=1 Tax=Candidatus Uhrbacteria bacterium RIFCSPHIGHO2_02_FULL_57_19 TaxID=1802391 RepID=A0A1F7U660_9BACT|nr:MAG: hypothetical protein A3D72_00655 [Candidatus Uhrbacteria bacterium RIFCSPHIGHO2_02_FULL_57_19]
MHSTSVHREPDGRCRRNSAKYHQKIHEIVPGHLPAPFRSAIQLAKPRRIAISEAYVKGLHIFARFFDVDN